MAMQDVPKVLVPLAQGCEELEAVTIIDVLRRANIDVDAVGLDHQPVKASRGVVLVPDKSLDEALKHGDYDMVVLPGGLPGADNLADDARLCGLLKEMAASGKFVCAICASPRVLALNGLLDGKKATAYPGFINGGDFPAVTYTGGAVERDGNVITSRGPGTAMDFALELVEALTNAATRKTVEESLVRG